MSLSNLVTGLVGLGLLGGLAWVWQASQGGPPSDSPESAPGELAGAEPAEDTSVAPTAPSDGDLPMNPAPLETARTTEIATFALG